jgi:hypothetical protein
MIANELSRRMLKDGKGAGFKGIGGEMSTPPNAGSLAAIRFTLVS